MTLDNTGNNQTMSTNYILEDSYMIGYKAKLAELGIVESRIQSIFDAMNSLHAAISYLDNQQLAVFTKAFTVLGHLDVFAREEGVRNVAREMYGIKLRKALHKIDFDEFPDFADKLAYMTEEAAEVDIPGAAQLLMSLKDMSKFIGPRNSKFKRLARWAENVSNIHGVSPRTLEYTEGIYKQHYDHMNDATVVGTATVLQTVHCKDDEGTNDSGSRLMFVRVTRDNDTVITDEVIKALKYTFSSTSCGHEHDCCGCERSSVRHAKYLTTNFNEEEIWLLRIHWNIVN